MGGNTDIVRKYTIVGEQGYYSAYPNPASNYLTISKNKVYVSTNLNKSTSSTLNILSFDQIVITDITGNIKLRQNVRATKNAQVDVSRLSNGIYYLNLYNAGKLIEKKTIQVAK